MVKVTENQIFLTKGDSAELEITIMDGDQEYDYSNDEVKFGVKKNFADKDCIIEKTVDENGKVSLEPEDTADLDVGTYFYDLKVVTADNAVCTVIAAAQFVIGHSVLTDFTAEEEPEEQDEEPETEETVGE